MNLIEIKFDHKICFEIHYYIKYEQQQEYDKASLLVFKSGKNSTEAKVFSSNSD